uniref:Uncharacterized protein n=1 Tax=Apteryx owenii TaxID=8824 RepID=A0A8B9S5W6_APTOW
MILIVLGKPKFYLFFLPLSKTTVIIEHFPFLFSNEIQMKKNVQNLNKTGKFLRRNLEVTIVPPGTQLRRRNWAGPHSGADGLRQDPLRRMSAAARAELGGSFLPPAPQPAQASLLCMALGHVNQCDSLDPRRINIFHPL